MAFICLKIKKRNLPVLYHFENGCIRLEVRSRMICILESNVYIKLQNRISLRWPIHSLSTQLIKPHYLTTKFPRSNWSWVSSLIYQVCHTELLSLWKAWPTVYRSDPIWKGISKYCQCELEPIRLITITVYSSRFIVEYDLLATMKMNLVFRSSVRQYCSSPRQK